MYDYVIGLYDFLERIVTRYPDLLIEGCSDNTDALDRLQIQYGTSFGYPISAVGSHVSAVPNHQTEVVANSVGFGESKAEAEARGQQLPESDGFMNIPEGADEELPFN